MPVRATCDTGKDDQMARRNDGCRPRSARGPRLSADGSAGVRWSAVDHHKAIEPSSDEEKQTFLRRLERSRSSLFHGAD